MKVSLEQKNKTEKELLISLPWSEFEVYLKQAEDDLIKEVQIKGFRKGKAPKEKALEKIGEQKLMSEAAAMALKDIYPKVIKEKELEPLGMPEVEILKLARNNNFEFKAKIVVLPEFSLPNYKEIAKSVSRKKIEVSKEELDSLYKQFVESKNKLSPEQLKQINFDKPEELKKLLKKDFQKQKEVIEAQRVRNEILNKIVGKTELEIPEVLLEAEFQRGLEELKANIQHSLKMTFEDYLKKVQKTEQELEQNLKENISQRIKRILVLKRIQEQEGIKAEEQEIEKQLNIFKANLKEEKPEIDDKSLRSYFRERLEQEKTLQFLEKLISPIIK